MPVHNEDIARIFEELADLLEIANANPFRIRAYRNAAATVRGLGEELHEMVAQGEDLTVLPAIGKDLANKIVEILQTGRAQALDELHQKVPPTLEALLKIPGLGPKRVKQLYESLHITTLDQLHAAASRGQLRQLPGMGVKTEQHILQNLSAHRTEERRFLYQTAHAYAQSLVRYLQAVKDVDKVVVAGSYRRGRETVGDLDILVSANDGHTVMENVVNYDEVSEVVSQGKTRATVFLRRGIQVDVRVIAKLSYGAALHYFTGSKAHNIQIRRIAQRKGLKLNEYGVFRGEQRIAGETEVSVYKTLDLPFIPPELREGRGELEAAGTGSLPKLIKSGDLQGDLHMHTTATDGRADIKQMAMAARAYGLKYIAITDHTRSLSVTNGLDETRLQQQIDEIDQLNEQFKDIAILKASEVDILEDGRLDLPDRVLSRLDLVLGSIHSRFRLSRQKQTSRILRAMDSKYFTILAHPSGRLLLERDAYAVDMPRIIEGARQRGCFLELNSQPQRLDLNDTYCQMAKDSGVLISINSDSHSTAQFDNLQGGIRQARRGWLEKGDVLNTRSLRDLRKLLKATM